MECRSASWLQDEESRPCHQDEESRPCPQVIKTGRPDDYLGEFGTGGIPGTGKAKQVTAAALTTMSFDIFTTTQ